MKDISMENLPTEKQPYELIEFLKIPLKHEIKTVEIYTSSNYVSSLKSKNDYLLLKYILELKNLEIARKTSKQFYKTNIKDSDHYAKHLDKDKGLLQTTRDDDIYESSIAITEPEPLEVITGSLRINFDNNDENVIEFPIVMKGIEAWLKYTDDYIILLNHMKIWEQQNLEYISDLTYEGQSFFNMPIETPERALTDSGLGGGKQKRAPGDFAFDDDEAEDLEGGVVDFDAIMRKKKNEQDMLKGSLIDGLPNPASKKDDRGFLKKLLCCY